jgi:hypothetical protein
VVVEKQSGSVDDVSQSMWVLELKNQMGLNSRSSAVKVTYFVEATLPQILRVVVLGTGSQRVNAAVSGNEA